MCTGAAVHGIGLSRNGTGSLRSIMKDLNSDENEEESDDPEDNDSESERTIHIHGGSRARRISLSDGSNSESSSISSPLRHEPPTLLKTNNNQILEVKSPIKQNKSEKQVKNGDCDKVNIFLTFVSAVLLEIIPTKFHSAFWGSMYLQSWPKILAPLHFCQIVHHFTQKKVEKQKSKCDTFHTKLQKWIGQN
ncbi:hypothetical protein AB205_0038890, partial [Aquarana catesbeiana]